MINSVSGEFFCNGHLIDFQLSSQVFSCDELISIGQDLVFRMEIDEGGELDV